MSSEKDKPQWRTIQSGDGVRIEGLRLPQHRRKALTVPKGAFDQFAVKA